MFRALNLAGKGVSRALGPLESALMEVVWGHSSPMSARDVSEAVQGGPRPPLGSLAPGVPALTTVVTTLERLRKKKFLIRAGRRGEYTYRAALSKSEFEQRLVQQVLESLVEDFRQPALSYLAQHLDLSSEEERDLRRELNRKLEGTDGDR